MGTDCVRFLIADSARPLRQIFQRPVHLFKSPPRVGIQPPRQDRDEQAGEALALDEPDTIRSQRLDSEAVLPVKEPGHEKMAQPSQLPARLDREDRWPEDHASRTGGLEPDFEPVSHPEISLHPPEERVPPGKPGNIGEQFPDPFRRCLDLDLGPEFHHRLPVGMAFVIKIGIDPVHSRDFDIYDPGSSPFTPTEGGGLPG